MRGFIVFAALFAVLVGTARADQASDLRDKLMAAEEKASSMVMQISAPSLGMTGVGTIVRLPAMAMHMSMATGSTKIEIYMIGQTMYEQLGGSWIRIQMPDMKQLEAMGRTITDKMHVSLAPDVVDGGVTYGAITFESDTATIPGAPVVGPTTQTCTYDKSTFFIHTCTNGPISETMSHYNDSANVVTLPPDAASAPALAPPVLPSPAPSPAAT